jgi:FkbM family methyltransferase
MMHVTPGRRPLVFLLTLTITALSLKCVGARETQHDRTLRGIVEWSGVQYSQCMSSWQRIRDLVPELGMDSNNLYSVRDVALKLDEATKTRLDEVAQVGGYKGIDSSAALFYVGGNENAAIGRKMHEEYMFEKVFVYEPFPPFYHKLKRVFAGKGISVFNYGLSDENKVLTVHDVGPGTSTHSGTDACTDGCQTVTIKDALPVFASLLKEIQPADAILYTNCEGCEIPVLERLLEGGLVQRFKYIHIATHADGTDHYVARLCRIREKLERTHRLLKDVPYAQERYVLKQHKR